MDLPEEADYPALVKWDTLEHTEAAEVFSTLRLCHHCQKLNSIEETVECGKPYKPVVRKLNQNNFEVDKGLMASLWCKFTREGRSSCPRIYCKFCLTYNYDEKDPLITGRFTCPACKVVSG